VDGVLVGTAHRRSHLHGGVLAATRRCIGDRHLDLRPDDSARAIVCLDETSRQVLAAWVAARTVDWRFTTENARIKLKGLYPVFEADGPPEPLRGWRARPGR